MERLFLLLSGGFPAFIFGAKTTNQHVLRPRARRAGAQGAGAVQPCRVRVQPALCTVLPMVAAVRELCVEGPPAASPEKPGGRV